MTMPLVSPNAVPMTSPKPPDRHRDVHVVDQVREVQLVLRRLAEQVVGDRPDVRHGAVALPRDDLEQLPQHEHRDEDQHEDGDGPERPDEQARTSPPGQLDRRFEVAGPDDGRSSSEITGPAMATWASSATGAGQVGRLDDRLERAELLVTEGRQHRLGAAGVDPLADLVPAPGSPCRRPDRVDELVRADRIAWRSRPGRRRPPEPDLMAAIWSGSAPANSVMCDCWAMYWVRNAGSRRPPRPGRRRRPSRRSAAAPRTRPSTARRSPRPLGAPHRLDGCTTRDEEVEQRAVGDLAGQPDHAPTDGADVDGHVVGAAVVVGLAVEADVLDLTNSPLNVTVSPSSSARETLMISRIATSGFGWGCRSATPAAPTTARAPSGCGRGRRVERLERDREERRVAGAVRDDAAADLDPRGGWAIIVIGVMACWPVGPRRPRRPGTRGPRPTPPARPSRRTCRTAGRRWPPCGPLS